MGPLQLGYPAQTYLALPTHTLDLRDLPGPDTGNEERTAARMSGHTTAVTGQILDFGGKGRLQRLHRLLFFRYWPMFWHNPAALPL